MTRAIDSLVLADLGLDRAEKTELIELNFSGGVIRVTTAAVDLLWNSVVWSSVGGHLEVEGFGESIDQAGNGNRVKLSGVDQTILAAILGQNYRGRVARIWYAHMHQTTGAVLGVPILMFDGYMNDGFQVDESRDFTGGAVDISTRFMVRINDLIKNRGIKTNQHSHQASGYAGVTTDTFFLNMPFLGRKVYWGIPAPYHGTIPAVGLPSPGSGASPGGAYPGGSGGTGVPKPPAPGIGGTFPGGTGAPGPTIDQSGR